MNTRRNTFFAKKHGESKFEELVTDPFLEKQN